jgi:hydroxypyruvate isomerase
VPRFSANISMLFRERPPPERFAAARAAGFAAVEIQFPYDTPIDDLVRAREEAGVAVDLINLPAGDFATGLRGIAGLPEARHTETFRAGVALGCGYARALGVRKVNVLAGLKPAGADDTACRARLVENLRYAADALNPFGIRVLLEAINLHDIPGFMVNLTGDAHEIAAAAATEGRNIAVQADIYHMSRMGQAVPAALAALGPFLGHLQFADAPGRGEPGSGTLDWPELFAAADATCYDGFVGAEYNPTRRTEDTLAWLRAAGGETAGG